MRFGNIGGFQNLLQASTVCIIASAGHSKRFGLSSFRGVCQTILGTDDAVSKSVLLFTILTFAPKKLFYVSELAPAWLLRGACSQRASERTSARTRKN